jgi:hypothetical protein
MIQQADASYSGTGAVKHALPSLTQSTVFAVRKGPAQSGVRADI